MWARKSKKMERKVERQRESGVKNLRDKYSGKVVIESTERKQSNKIREKGNRETEYESRETKLRQKVEKENG